MLFFSLKNMKIGSWLAFNRRHFNFKVHKISGGKLSRDPCDESESKIQCISIGNISSYKNKITKSIEIQNENMTTFPQIVNYMHVRRNKNDG